MYNSDEEELERLKMEKLRKWIAEQQARKALEEQMAEMQRAAEAEAIKKAIFLRYVTPDVRSRLANIRLVNPEMADRIENYILALLQSGRVQKVNFEIFKRIVETIRGKK